MWCIVCCVFLAAWLHFLYRDARKPKGFPPGPKWRPIVGSLLEMRALSRKFGFHYRVLEELCRIYGPAVGLRLGRDRIVVISEHENVKKILLSEEFDGRPDGFSFRMRSFRKRLGIVFVDGPSYHEQKRFCLAALKKLGMGKKMMEEIIIREAEELVNAISRRCDIPNMETIFDVAVLNSLWSFMTGKRFDLEDEKLADLIRLVHDAFRLLDMSGGVLNQMPFLRFVAPNATGYNKMRFANKRFEDFLRDAVAGNAVQGNSLIDLFLAEMKARNGSDSNFTEEQLIVLLLDLFMAGSETTSNSLSTAILYMIVHPEIQEKVQAEIDGIVPRDRLPTLRDRPRLGYVEAVLLEVLRHGTIVPVSIAHRSDRDVPHQGFLIPKDTTILLSLRSVLMDKEHWGDPENFRPERFLDENGQIVQDEWFYPFGQGKRRCLGESLARSSMFIMFAAVMQNFHVAATGRQPSLTPRDGLTLSPRPFGARLTLRKTHSG